MAGNSNRRGAVKKSSKGNPTAGSGGRRRKGLEGKGPTPKAEDRPYHKQHKMARAAERRAQSGQQIDARLDHRRRVQVGADRRRGGHRAGEPEVQRPLRALRRGADKHQHEAGGEQADAQRRAGEVLQNKERTHVGLAYQARTLRRRGGESMLFLASSGRIGIVASGAETREGHPFPTTHGPAPCDCHGTGTARSRHDVSWRRCSARPPVPPALPVVLDFLFRLWRFEFSLPVLFLPAT